MRRLLPLLFALSTLSLAANDHVSGQSVIAVSYGQFYPQFSPLNAQLRAWGMPKGLSYYRTAGISFAGTMNINRNGTFDGMYAFEIIVPQTFRNDSGSIRLSGMHLMTSTFGFDVFPWEKVALVIAPGIDWGSMTLKHKYGQKEDSWKNPFIAPFARAELRFVFGHFAFGIRGISRYDISKSRWKITSGNGSLPGTKMHGLGVQFFLGYGVSE